MFVDASALVAILRREVDADRFVEAIAAAPSRSTSPVSVYEAVVALMSKKGFSLAQAEAETRDLLSTAGISVVAITDEIGRAALDAFDRYGKGRGHPAQLNMGDCFSYGAARVLGVPLLYKGADFAATELA